MIIKSQISFLKSVLYLAAVVECGTITAAAERNGIKATNLSRLIKDLEETIGTPLFIRKSNGMIPTDAALCLYEKAQQLEKNLKQVHALKAKANKKRLVKLYIPDTLNMSFLKRFSALHIQYVAEGEAFHVGIFYEKPMNLPASFQIGEYNLSINGLSQKFWIACQTENPQACVLVDFIVSQLFP